MLVRGEHHLLLIVAGDLFRLACVVDVLACLFLGLRLCQVVTFERLPALALLRRSLGRQGSLTASTELISLDEVVEPNYWKSFWQLRNERR